MKTMNTLAKYGAGALGALALTFGAAGVAGAQDDAPADDAEIVEQDAESSRSERRAAKKAAIADIVGLSVDELSEARQSGQSLAEIAGDDVDEVVEFLTENAEARIAARVEAGRLTEEEAAERRANIEERISERIENTEVRERGERRGHRGDRSGNGAQAEATVDS